VQGRRAATARSLLSLQQSFHEAPDLAAVQEQAAGRD
jgi:hypothetical protein